MEGEICSEWRMCCCMTACRGCHAIDVHMGAEYGQCRRGCLPGLAMI